MASVKMKGVIDLVIAEQTDSVISSLIRRILILEEKLNDPGKHESRTNEGKGLPPLEIDHPGTASMESDQLSRKYNARNMEKIMTRILTITLAFFTLAQLNGQIMYRTEFRGEADKKVYVTEFRGEADLFVYVTEFRGEARMREGFWYWTTFRGEANQKVFFTKFRGEADLFIYYTEFKGEAGPRD